jgi:CBS domain-containing protein
MALAGPIASIGIGALCFVLLGIGRSAAWSNPPLIIFSYLGTINIVLAIFNLLPAFPLDGGRVFRSLLWKWKGNIVWATRVASAVGSGFGLFLIFAGLFFVFAGGIVSGIWWTLIGLFLRGASKMSLQTILVRSALEGEPVKKFMKEDLLSVSPDVTLDHLVDDYIYKYHHRIYPVVQERMSLRYVTIGDVKSVPRSEWTTHTVAEFAHPCSRDTMVFLDEDALKALSVMNKSGNNRLMVVDHGGKLVGVVALQDLLKYLSTREDFDDDSWSQHIDQK